MSDDDVRPIVRAGGGYRTISGHSFLSPPPATLLAHAHADAMVARSRSEAVEAAHVITEGPVIVHEDVLPTFIAAYEANVATPLVFELAVPDDASNATYFTIAQHPEEE